MFEKTIRISSPSYFFSNNAIIPSDIWSVSKRLNSDVWADHVACKFPRFFHEPPMLYCHWETIIDFKWQKQGLLWSFRSLTGWGLYWFVWKYQREQLKGRTYQTLPLSIHLFSHWSIPLIRYSRTWRKLFMKTYWSWKSLLRIHLNSLHSTPYD